MTNSSKLIELYKKYNSFVDVEYPSDKNSYHTYIEDVYEECLTPYRNKKINFLEIGVAWGGSIRLWSEYFKYAIIYGIDNFSSGEIYKNKNIDLINGKNNKINILVEDAYLEETANKLPNFDIIIDDGPHDLRSQKLAIRYYLPKLNKDGIMFIEDIPIDFDYDIKNEFLNSHPIMQDLLNEIPNDMYEYKIFDLRTNAANLGTNPPEGRGDNVILAIKPL